MKISLFIILLLSLVISKNMNGQEKNSHIYSEVTKFDPSRNPVQDLKDAVVEAKRSNRRIILDIGGDWCIWCHRIDDFIKGNKELSNLLYNNFVLVKVNYSSENKNEEFLSNYPKIPGYPHFFVLDQNGKLMHSQNTGALEKVKGYDRGKFVAFLKKWAPEKK